MIIDGHVHLVDPPHDEEKVVFNLADGSTAVPGMSRDVVTPGNLIASMDKNGIEKAVVMALDICTNEYLSETVKRHEDRLLGFAWVDDPKDAQESIRQFEEAVGNLGLVGLKLHPDMQGFKASDPEIVPLVRRAAELDVPVLIHSMQGFPGYFYYNLPWHIDVLNHRVPEAKIIVAHMFGYRFMDVITLAERPNIYTETSWGLTAMAELQGLDFVNRFVRRIGVDNLIYGSDWVGPHGEMERQIELIRKLDLTREEEDKILGENLFQILNL
jgi:predicted TIM-barrel fold metal-dependent hydrolase